MLALAAGARAAGVVRLRRYTRSVQPEIEFVGSGKDKRYAVRYRCPWCGENSRIPASNGVQLINHEVAFLVVCEASLCRRPAMVLAHQVVNPYEGTVERVHGMEVHPSPRASYREKGVPPEIARDFQEALACQAAGFNYAVALVARRVLQATAREVIGGERTNLAAEINAIPAGRISDTLRNSAHHVRFVGNDAAHANSVSSDEVEHLVVFTEQLLDALYVQPAVLAEAQATRPKPAATPKPTALAPPATKKSK